MTVLLAACTGLPVDPALAARREALDQWERGAASLAAGDATAARAAFAAARGAHPDPLLGAWEAKALASGGDVEGAVALLAEVLAGEPTFALARYNRAAWLVRLDRRSEAAAELARALADGAADPLDVLGDADFAPVLDDPAFAFLPRSLLVATVDPVPPTAFLGTEVPVVVHLIGRLAPPVALDATARGPVALVAVREEESSAGRTVTFLVEVTGPGAVEVGPFEVRAGATARADGVSFTATAPSGRTGAPRTEVLALPSSLLASVADRGVAEVGGTVLVRARDADRVETTPALAPPVLFEWRPASGPREVVRAWPAGGRPERVRIVAPTGEVVTDVGVAAALP